MIEWNERYNTGVPRIDAQHQIFLTAIQDFQSARQDGASAEKLTAILKEITLYARYHFFSEENVMKECGYPELSEHTKMHYQLLDVMNGRMLGLNAGLSTPRQVEEFLIQWFVEHTSTEDRKIGQFILDSGQQLP